MGRYNPGQPVTPGMGGYGEDTPMGAYDMGQQGYTSLQQPQRSMGNRLGNVLAQGLMAYGQGMTGQPFLTNYNTLQQDTANKQAEMQYNIWKTNKMSTMGKPIFTIGDNNELVNIGSVPKGSQVVETPQQKMTREITTAQGKKSNEVESEMKSIDDMISSLYETADKLIPAVENPKLAEKVGLGRTLGSASIAGFRPQRLMGLSDENTIAYNDIMKAEATPVIRALGEKGMLTNQDIERALGLFPKNSDSIQLRKTRKEELSKFLKSKIKAYYKGKLTEEIVDYTTDNIFEDLK